MVDHEERNESEKYENDCHKAPPEESGRLFTAAAASSKSTCMTKQKWVMKFAVAKLASACIVSSLRVSGRRVSVLWMRFALIDESCESQQGFP